MKSLETINRRETIIAEKVRKIRALFSNIRDFGDYGKVRAVGRESFRDCFEAVIQFAQEGIKELDNIEKSKEVIEEENNEEAEKTFRYYEKL